MNTRQFRLSLSGAVLLAVASPALAQHGHSAPAPAPAPRPSFSAPATTHAPSTSLGPRDVIGAFGYNANLGSNSAAPLSPRFNLSTNIGFSSTPPVQYNPPLNSAPNTFFPSKTTGFSTSPLFPYSSPSYPYGYGFLAREPNDETQRKPLVPMREYTADPNSATMKVVVPANAEIWFEGSKTGQSGTTRTFVSPPLEPGRGFTYEVRARWTEGGKEVERTRQLHVHAGENVQVDFGAKK